MKHCQACFSLIRDSVRRCPACQTDLDTQEPIAAEHDFYAWMGDAEHRTDSPEVAYYLEPPELEPPAPPPLPQEVPPPASPLAPAALTVRRMMMVAILISVSVISLVILVDRHRQAEASISPQAQLVQQHAERQEELAKAIHQLDRLYRDMKRVQQSQGMDAAERRTWAKDWRDRVQRVKDQYRLYGEINYTRVNAQAEDALRNATLYLSSLEASAVSSARQRPSDHERAFIKTIDTARKSIQ